MKILPLLLILVLPLFNNLSAQLKMSVIEKKAIYIKEEIKHNTRKGFLTFKPLNQFYFQNEKQFDRLSHFLDGDLSPHFYLFDKAKRNFKRHIIDIHPRLHFRILDIQQSGPVRTPTANPGLIWNITFKLKSENPFVLYGGYYHHSNGQDGKPLAVDLIFDPELDLEYLRTERRFNVYNGNFATNYFPFGIKLFNNKNRISPKIPFTHTLERKILGRSFSEYLEHSSNEDVYLYNSISSISNFYDIGFEVHSKALGIGPSSPLFGFEPELIGYYSFFDFKFSWNRIRLFKQTHYLREFDQDLNKEYEYDRIAINLLTRLGDVSQLNDYHFFKRLNFDISYMIRFDYSSQTGIYFKAGYYGSDQYNIYLEDEYFFFMVGLTTGSFHFK